MSWLTFFGVLWGTIAALVLLFVAVDARNAFDADPDTRTLSGYIRAWRRQRSSRSLLLGATILLLALVPVWLFAHLVLDL